MSQTDNQTGWTMKQIADELGVNKMKVYRTINRHEISESFKKGQALYYNEDARKQIEQFINENPTHTGNNKEVVEDFKESLNKQIKNQQEQIENLTKLLDQSQRLQLIAEQRSVNAEKKVIELQNKLKQLPKPKDDDQSETTTNNETVNEEANSSDNHDETNNSAAVEESKTATSETDLPTNNEQPEPKATEEVKPATQPKPKKKGWFANLFSSK